MKHWKQALVLGTATLLSTPVWADGLVLEGDLSFGGDDVVEVSGGPDFKAGEGIRLAIGYSWDINSEETKLVSTFGYMFKFDSYENGDADFQRFPLEVLLSQQLDKVAISAGASYHINPKLSVDADGIGDGTAKFDDALGFTASVAYRLDQEVEVGLKATAIDYEIGNAEVSGNNVGLYVRVYR